MMQLYTSAMPPNPRRVNQFVQYKNLELETQQIDMMTAEQFSETYKAINPESTIPALVLDDGTLLNEVVGICFYLESLYPSRPLLGTSGLEQALIVSAMHNIANTGFQAVAEVLRNGSKAFVNRALPGSLDLEQIPELILRGQKKLAHFYERYDRQLQDREYLVGTKLTQADIDLRVLCDFAAVIKQRIPEHCEALLAHKNRISAEIPLPASP
ncbi:MAG: glutathione S-transferase [Halieaceae bacterium]|jgi:glutathione S-transferase